MTGSSWRRSSSLGRKGIKTLEDLADLAADEMVELVPDAGIGVDDAGAIIMDARVRLGWIEAPEPEAEPSDDRRAGRGGAALTR